MGIVASLGAIPVDVLGAVFGAPAELFKKIPRKLERITITRKHPLKADKMPESATAGKPSDASDRQS